MKRSTIYRVVLGAMGFLVLVVIAFIGWASMVYKPEPEKLKLALDEVQNNVSFTEKSNYWEITPKSSDSAVNKNQETGFIFYPGAKVEPEAYFYKLSSLSNGQASKVKVFVTKPTLNLAFFSINQADEVIQDHPEITKWIIGGHSLGGSMSCEYAKTHNKISELWLFSSYCGSDISQKDITVVSIHGSVDGVLTPQKLSDNRKNLPASIADEEIEGMNHAQIGNYGDQSGDNTATKNDEDVRNEITRIFSELLSKN